MTYKAYLDNIYTETGKTAEYFRKTAEQKGLTGYSELLRWLKKDCGLGHGHANAVILYIRDPESARKKLQAEARAEKRRR